MIAWLCPRAGYGHVQMQIPVQRRLLSWRLADDQFSKATIFFISQDTIKE